LHDLESRKKVLSDNGDVRSRQHPSMLKIEAAHVHAASGDLRALGGRKVVALTPECITLNYVRLTKIDATTIHSFPMIKPSDVETSMDS
jgi:hypothetical protein